jgi:cytosine/adenosine deaminase-related metal-dependent hydrolase
MVDSVTPHAVTARRVRTMISGAAPIEGAALVFAGRRLLDVGPRHRVLAGFSGPVRDLGPVTLMPGLVNAHAHLELSHLRGLGPRGQGFAAWAAWLVGALRTAASPADLDRAVAEAAATGTGAVIDVGSRSTTAVVRALETAGLAGLVCHEFFGWRPEPLDGPPPALLAAGLAMGHGRVAVSGHALYSTSPDNLVRARDICRRLSLPFCLHLAEDRAEVELLATGGGALAALLSGRILPRDFVPPGRSPVAQANALGLLGPDTLAVHAVWLTREDRAVLARTGTAVCLCPRSNAAIGVGTADAPALAAAGIPLCLGTDSLASNDDLDLWNEARRLLADHPDFPARLVAAALTTTPARLLGRSGDLGSLAPGAMGGYAVVPSDLEERLWEDAGRVADAH